MLKLLLKNLTKTFGRITALQDVSLEIQPGELFSILGPSGCGKTTLLRLIAGFENPTQGAIFMDDVNITNTPPQCRNTSMVFQNYALFPHMTVFENVAFGLENKKLSKSGIQNRVQQVLEMIQLTHKLETPVPNLSGGEQQRVALARAIVVEPQILLFDEPLSNLDVALRAETREQIKQLQRKTKITSVYVTHDQSEALAISDRIAILNQGKVIQVGTAKELYDHPRDIFVATFLGNANILHGTITRVDPLCLEVQINEQIRFCAKNVGDFQLGNKVSVVIKPEHLTFSENLKDSDFQVTVLDKEFLGALTQFTVQAGNVVLKVLQVTLSKELRQIGDRLGIKIQPELCKVFSYRGDRKDAH